MQQVAHCPHERMSGLIKDTKFSASAQSLDNAISPARGVLSELTVEEFIPLVRFSC